MLQAKKTVRKGCKIYVVNIQIYNVENKQEIENISIINEFKDVFPEELLGLIPKWELVFSIEIVLGVVLIPKELYFMNTP